MSAPAADRGSGPGPFARLAAVYRERGFAPVPVRPGTKAPCLPGWSRWCGELPPPGLLQEWARRYPDAGLSIALGRASGVVALDLDHDIDGPRDASRAAALAEALTHIPACCDYHSWVRVGMALRAELGDAGLDVWDDWSAGSPNYEARQMAAKWRSFSGRGITAGTLFHLARQHGWRRSRR